MKKTVLFIIALIIGFVIGYLCRTSSPEKQQEIIKQAIERKDKIQDVNTSLNIYCPEEDNCEDSGYHECDDFGPV